MRRRRVAATLLLLVACGEPDPPPALSVGDVAYTETELGALDRAGRERLALLAAFGQAAAAGRLNDVMHAYIERDRRSELLERFAAEIALREAGLSESELHTAYLRDPERELTVRHLVVLAERFRSDAQRAEARARAARALARIRAGEPFVQVAADVSEEPGAAERGGLLEPGRRGTWVEEFWTAALALEEGEVSDVVETPYGFHVLRLEARRPVPWQEARSRALPRLVSELGALEEAEMWADSVAEVLVPDAAAIARARADRAGAGDVLVRWPGGDFTAAELRTFLGALAEADRARVAAADSAAFERVVMGVARNELLADLARDSGLALDSAAVAAIEWEWVGRARAWATALGFERGQTDEAVKVAALAALDEDAQSAAIAREEVVGLERALRRRYRIDLDPGAEPVDDSASSP
ncbi:MAG: peptidylprolyl isomerase [Longimicrobiales bacterium]